MTVWWPYEHQYGVDMIPEDEVDYHYMNAVDPLIRPLHNEDGDLLGCLCKPLVVYTEGLPRVYHRVIA